MSRRVSCIPSADDVFCAAGAAALNAIGDIPVEAVAAALVALLRDAYPSVEVHRQVPLARAFDEEVWYAYRDGQPKTGGAEGSSKTLESAATSGT
jgi:hypothetical protein